MQTLDRFSAFLYKHAPWVIYIRRDENFTCQYCSPDPNAGEGDPTCPMCMGTGYPVTLEKVKVLIAKANRTARPNSDNLPGLVSLGEIRAYFTKDDLPKQGDYLLEVEWTVDSDYVESVGEPVSIIHAYKVDTLEPQYDEDILYFSGVLDVMDTKKAPLEKALFTRNQ